MSDLTALSTESVKGLGPGAYLVNVLPSTVLILSTVAVLDSRLLPWATPRPDDVPAGPASVYAAFGDRGVVGAVVLVLGVVVLAVMLRPFQIRTVQLLEGYWRRGGLVKALAVERHTRNSSAILARRDAGPFGPAETTFEAVARHARRHHRAELIRRQAAEDRPRYPSATGSILPTALGNVLRHSETTAGERYGLDTIAAYPRLVPYLSRPLETEISTKLNAIDAMSTFVLVFSAQALVSAPLVARLDWWSLLPGVLLTLAALAYRGAVVAGREFGVYLSTAFDLHRWDMLAAMHLPLPADGAAEFELNERVNALLAAEAGWAMGKRLNLRYEHPPESPGADGLPTG